MSVRWGFGLAALLVASVTIAQERTECDDNWGWRGPNAHVCEVRDLTVPAGGTLSVDAGQNGSIRVAGESRREGDLGGQIGRGVSGPRQTGRQLGRNSFKGAS